LKKPSRKAWDDVVPAEVAKALPANASLSSLIAVQAAFDKAPDHGSKIKVLQTAADNFRVQASKVKNQFSLEAMDLFKMKAKCEKRLAYELLAAGKLRDAYKIQPEDLA
jgi:hypothetical protein